MNRGDRHGGLWWAALALLVFAVLAPAAWAAPTVEDIRMATAAGHTRAVIDLTGPVEYKLFQLSNPDRIVIDLQQAGLEKDFASPSTSGPVQRVRTGQRPDHGLRVVLDMDRTVHPRSFLLEPGQQRAWRLVLDLYEDPQLAERKALPVDQPEGRDVVVVIDAGHGGVDPGAIGAKGTREKDITLKVAKALAGMVDKQPGMRAVLTRDDDTFLPLKRRYQIAREHHADLFISLHADAFRDPAARGSSVWVLSTHGKVSEAARWLANRENSADLVGGVSLEDKSDTLAAVLLDLSQGASMEISNAVASNVLAALDRLGRTHKDRVEHANFVVLRSPDVPSILVETAFITNPHEERQLRDAGHRRKLASAILDGVMDYFRASPPMGTWLAMQARRADEKHVVARGETLSAIADRYGVPVGRLLQANHLDDRDLLRIGAVLTIPAS